MNLVGAFFGSFPTAGALSRTVLQDATGGNTQLVGFISSGIVFLAIEFLGSLFGPLPNVSVRQCLFQKCGELNSFNIKRKPFKLSER